MYCGCETYESVVNLKQGGEIENAFFFVKDNIDIFDNKEEFIGIFINNPDKLKVLPGLKHVLEKFINSVENLKRSSVSHAPSNTNVSLPKQGTD